MLHFNAKKNSYFISRFFMLSVIISCFFFCQATSVNADSFSAEEELKSFRTRLQKHDSAMRIGYVVQLYLSPDQTNDELLEKAVGTFFYKGKAGYLAHVDLFNLVALQIYGISYRIIDKKPLKDQSERWYLVEFNDEAEFNLIKSRFEPLFVGKKTVLIRIRQSDSEWLTHNKIDVHPVAETDESSKSEDKSIKLPYFSQYKNKLYPGGTCQNTCLAMILRYYGWNGVPDDITRVWGSKTAQTPEGGAKVFNSYASKLGLKVRAKGNRAAYARFREKLGKGHPLIVHGYFTAGHVVIANSCDGQYYDCHDPAGKWNQVYKGSYNTGVSGKNQKYRKSNFDKAVSPDGMVWWVEFNQAAYIDM